MNRKTAVSTSRLLSRERDISERALITELLRLGFKQGLFGYWSLPTRPDLSVNWLASPRWTRRSRLAHLIHEAERLTGWRLNG